MKSAIDTAVLDNASFVGVLSGIALLLVAFFVEDLRGLAVPALLVLFPSLVYGLR